MSIAVELCNDIAEVLNAHEFSMPIHAAFEPIPRWDIQAVRKLEVFVFPDWETRTRKTRDLWTVESAINIGFMKHIDKATRAEETAKLMNLVDEVANFAADAPLPHCPWAQATKFHHKLNQRPFYFWEHIQQYSTFTSVLSLVFIAGTRRYGRA